MQQIKNEIISFFIGVVYLVSFIYVINERFLSLNYSKTDEQTMPRH